MEHKYNEMWFFTWWNRGELEIIEESIQNTPNNSDLKSLLKARFS